MGLAGHWPGPIYLSFISEVQPDHLARPEMQKPRQMDGSAPGGGQLVVWGRQWEAWEHYHTTSDRQLRGFLDIPGQSDLSPRRSWLPHCSSLRCCGGLGIGQLGGFTAQCPVSGGQQASRPALSWLVLALLQGGVWPAHYR